MKETTSVDIIYKIVEGYDNKIGGNWTNILEKIIDFFVNILRSVALIKNNAEVISDAVNKISDWADKENFHSGVKQAEGRKAETESFTKRVLEKKMILLYAKVNLTNH